MTIELFLGELTLLVGSSGCGKTTLISILAGTLNPTGGSADEFGLHLATLGKNARADFRAQNVAFVFRQFNLLPALTSVENVTVPLVIRGMWKVEAAAKTATALTAVGVDHRLHSFPGQLSCGQQQRVALSRKCLRARKPSKTHRLRSRSHVPT